MGCKSQKRKRNSFQCFGRCLRQTLAFIAQLNDECDDGFSLGGDVTNADTTDFQFSEQGAGGGGNQPAVFAAHNHLIIADELRAAVNQAQSEVRLAAT